MFQDESTSSALEILAVVLALAAADYLLSHLCRHVFSKPMVLTCLILSIALTGLAFYSSGFLHSTLGEHSVAVQLFTFFSIFTCFSAWTHKPDGSELADIHPTYIDRY
ncbi:MAG: hypothetical protein ACPHXW_04550 [Marinobacterium sp.]